MYFAESRAWSIVEDWHSNETFCARIIPLVGDVNGDGVPELLVFKSAGYFTTNEMYVYDTRTHSIVHSITLPSTMKVDHAAPYGMLKMPATASPAIAGHVFAVVALSNKSLHAFDLTAHGTSPVWSATGTTFDAPTVAFSDFNCDGHPEVYIGNKIYDAETGVLLGTAPGSNVGRAHGHANATFCVASFAADVMGDGKPDLILGNEVYRVNITNRYGTAGNSITLAASCTPPSSLPADGHAQVADFNLDGYLDILITNKTTSYGDASLYVWDVHNNTVSNPVIEGQCYEGMSVPLIADIDNDGTVEVVWQTAYCPHSSNGNNMRAYKYNPTTRTFSEMWQLRIRDDSFSVPATIFDLNNDGYNDLLVTDDNGVRILNGSGKSHLTGRDTLSVYEESPTFNFRANTTMQYAVVADVDGSGSAKIVALGRNGSYDGYIYVFRSVDDPWMPARKVWNQYLYNVTCVNEDLTIPQHPYNNAMALTDPVSGVVRRPYNNCLQQATAIDIYGRKVTITPDANNATLTSTSVGDTVFLSATWCNNGAADLIAPYPVMIFANSTTGTRLIDTTAQTVLPRGGCTTMTLKVPSSRVQAAGASELLLLVNGNTTGVAQAGGLQMECNIDNNTAIVPIIAIRDTADSTVCANRLPITWNDSVFTAAGNKITRLTAANGSDSMLMMRLHVNPVYTGIEDYDTVIQNALPYQWQGLSFSAAGDQTATLVSKDGCDSTVTMHLFVHMNKHVDADSTVCDNLLPFTWNGETFTSATTLTATLTGQYGVDSVVTMHLHLSPTFTVDDHDTVIENNLPYSWEGINFNMAGSQTTTLTSLQGCDSTVTMHLFVWLNKTATADSIVCENTLPLIWNNVSFNTPDTLTATLTASHGEDSLLTMNVSTYPIFTTDDYDTIIENALPYTWQSLTFTASDDQTTTLPSIHGCDSTVTMHLFVWQNLAATDEQTVCDNQLPIMWNGVTFTDATTQNATLTAQHGEDSVVAMTLHVNPTYTTTEEAEICDNESYTFHGTTYRREDVYSHTLTTSQGCDSVASLRLTVHRTYRTSASDDICANASYTWGTPMRTVWTPVNPGTAGADQQRSITETDHLQSVDGCDSTSTLTLTIHGVHLRSSKDTICFGETYSWRNWTGQLNSEYRNEETTRTFTDTIPTLFHGCDSVLQLTLTQRPHPVVVFQYDEGCTYKVTFTTDAPYHTLSAIPHDPNIDGLEQDLAFETSPREPTIYTVLSDFSATPTCPWTESLRLIPIIPARSIIKASPEVLSADKLELNLYDANSARLRRHWYINGIEQPDTAWHIIYNADIADDSVEVALAVFNHECGDTSSLVVYIRHEDIFAPNAFTPEHDINNKFIITGKDVVAGELSIYDRRGALVFRTEDYSNGWDGAGAPQATYVWVFRYSNKGMPTTTQFASGTVTLIR